MGNVVLVLLVVACNGSSAPTSPPPPEACKVDDDCEISCAAKGQCCNHPFCERVQLRSVSNAAIEYNAAHPCTKKQLDACPVVGGRVQPDYVIVPRCRAGACVAEKQPK